MPNQSRSLRHLVNFTFLIASMAGLMASGGAPASAQGMMRDDSMRGGSRGGMREGGMRDGGGRGIGTGIGIGVGIGIANEVIQRQRATDKENEFKKTKQQKKTTAKKGGNDKPTKADLPSDGKKPPAGQPPVEKVVFTPPVFPTIDKLENCNDCMALWEAIVRYERNIAEDMKRLAERQQQVLDSIAERAKLVAALAKATADYDRVYYTRMIEITDDSIKVNTAMNADLQKLINEEQKILMERIAQYEKCADAYCRKQQVVEGPPVQPPAIPVTPPTTVSKPPEQPPEQPKNPPQSAPPDQNVKICGPDITDLVLDALRRMKETYESNPDKQTEACRTLFDKKTGPSAWDISQLSPGSSPMAGMNYNPATDQWEMPPDPSHPESKPYVTKPWFTRVSNMCAIPRPVCGATVEFLGTCQHAQVVNYTQWGMMMSLCGGLYPLLGQVAHAAWNYDRYGSTAPGKPQQNMVKVGSEYKDALDKASTIPDISQIKKNLKDRDAEIKHDEQQCELKCELTEAQRNSLRSEEFRWHWTGLTDDPTAGRTTREDATNDAKQLGDKARDKAKAASDQARDKINNIGR